MDVVYVSAHAVYYLHLSQISQCTSAESSAKYYLFKTVSVAEIGLLPCLFLCPQEMNAVFCEVLDGMGKERDGGTSRLYCAVMAFGAHIWHRSLQGVKVKIVRVRWMYLSPVSTYSCTVFFFL